MLSHRMMAVVQSWYVHLMDLVNAAADEYVDPLDPFSITRKQLRSETQWRAQITFLELATTCLVQSESLFFHAQAPVLLDVLKPFVSRA